jgi:hypothetical protein
LCSSERQSLTNCYEQQERKLTDQVFLLRFNSKQLIKASYFPLRHKEYTRGEDLMKLWIGRLTIAGLLIISNPIISLKAQDTEPSSSSTPRLLVAQANKKPPDTQRNTNRTSNILQQSESGSPSPTPTVPAAVPSPNSDSKIISENASIILNAVLAISTILFMSLTYSMNRKRSEAEHTLERTKNYIKDLLFIEYIYQDIVMLGPRNSGKTSVAKLWSEPAFDIKDVAYTKTWTEYARDILELAEYSREHDVFNISIKHQPRIRIKIHDYPGEDRWRTEAIKKLPEFNKSILLLFFDVYADSSGLHKTPENNKYYSQVFVDTLKQQEGIGLNISKVIVVFNKADLLPSNMDIDQAKEALKKLNADAIDRIEGQFSGILDYLVISALDNRGLITLLGAAVSPTLPVEIKHRFDVEISKLALDPKSKG